MSDLSGDEVVADVSPSNKGRLSRIPSVAILVAAALAVGLIMAATGMNGRRFGCGTSCNAPDVSPRSERIVAFYFHNSERSPTCTRVEKAVVAALRASFSEELRDGRLEWRVVNYKGSGNEHYVTEYKLAAPCLVLARMKDDVSVEWRSLPWAAAIMEDHAVSVKLLQNNVREFLDYVAIPGACCT